MSLQKHYRNLKDSRLKGFKNNKISNFVKKEVAAVKFYALLVNDVEGKYFEELITLKNDHERALVFWSREARKAGTIPSRNANLWGVISNSIISSIRYFSKKLMIYTLKLREKYALYSYKKVLDCDQITKNQKEVIRTKFIPRHKKHIKILDNLLKV